MTPSDTWTIIASLAAGASAVFAAIYTALTYRLVRSQADPHVVIFVRHDDSRPSIIEIVIQNIGRGLATEITFSSDEPIPHKAFGVSPDTAQPAGDMTSGPLIEGIRSLGPGDSRRITWGQYGGLFAALGNRAITVTCTYRAGKKAMPEVTGILEVASFTGTFVATSEASQIAKSLDGIAEAVRGTSRNLLTPLSQPLQGRDHGG